jgi:cephalosporin hydroxylase
MIEQIVAWLQPFPRTYRAARWAYRAWQRARSRRRQRRERLIARDFHRVFYNGPAGHGGLWYSVRWLGVPVLKCPFDLCVVQEILFETRPDLIIECGVYSGGSTLFLASLCDLLGTGRVLACDVTLARVEPAVRSHPRVELVEMSSVSSEFHALARQRAAGRRVMVILDSDHQRDHVLQELRLFGPLVTPGCYCEDTNINGHPVYPTFGPGPYEALQQYLGEAGTLWTVDEHRERLLVTFNPRGYLRRNSGEQEVAR